MITVHHEKETDFSKNGYGSIDDYVFGAEVNWELNGQFSAYLEYPTFLDKANNLVNKNILRVPVPFMDDQLFRIYRTRKVLGFIQIEARHIFYDLLDNFIEDTNIVAKNGSQAIDQLLSATQYPHRFQGFSNINTVRNARMVRYNPVEALLDDSQANTFVSRWGGEIVRDNFTIRMYQQMGSDKGVHIQHKKDLTGYEATFDESTVTTRIMPVGFDGLKLPEMYVDSPLIDLDNPKIDTIKYDTVKAAIGEYANAEDAVPLEEAYALLRQYAKEEYSVNHVDEPRATVKVDFVNLHNTKEYEGFESLQAIHQGDTVKISVIDEGFEITSRLVAFKSDPLQKDHYTSTTLGNHVYAFTSSVNSTTQLRNDVEQLKEDVIMAMQSASGKNRNFWGSADPNTLNLNADVGDNYFRANGEETMLYQYVEINGEKYWKQILDTAQLATIQAEVEKAQATANQAKLDASGAYTNAVAEAERLVSASDEVWQGKMTEFDEQVGLIEVSVQSAQTKADNALREVGISTDLAQTAKGLADTAKTNAQTAISNASQAKADAQTAINNAQSALTEAGDAKITANSLSVKVDDLEGEVELKASQTEVDGISGTVSTHTSTLGQHATAINARLTSSQVNSLVDGKGLAKVTYVDSQINATAESFGINMTRVEAKFDGLEIGGRNYFTKETPINVKIPGSDFVVRGPETPNGFKITGRQGGDTSLRINNVITSNGWWTVSFDIRGRQSVPVAVDINDKGVTRISANNKNTYERKSVSVYVDNYSETVHNFVDFDNFWWAYYFVDNIKVEKGNKATDWTPAPEDTLMQNDFNVFRNSYQSTVDSINTELSKTAKITDLNGMVTESVLATKQFVTQGSITTTLSDYLKTIDLNGKVKETVAYQDIKETTDRYTRVIGSTDAESRTKIAQIAMSDSVFQTTVLDKMEFDTSNTFSTKTSLSSLTNMLQLFRDESLAPNGIRFAGGTGGNGSFRLRGVITRNGWWTVSGWVRGSQNANGLFRLDIADSPYSHYISMGTDNDWKYFEFSHEVKNHSSTYNFVDFNDIANLYYFIKDLKIEQNHKATPYSLAPADVATQSQVTQLSNSWALTLKSGNDIKTQINASTDAIRLSSKFIHLNGSSLIDNATIKSAHIYSLNANKITGNTADFNTIRTGVLQANVITSTHLSVDNAMIDKLFATDLLVERLTSKTAFINDIKAINISADRITTGTLNASNVSIINLDVNSLTGNVSSFIQSAWNGINGTVNIDSEGIGIKNNNLVSYSMRINNQGMHVYDSGQRVGFVSGMYAISGGATKGLALATASGYRVAMSYQVGTSTTYREALSVKSDGTIEVGHNYQYPSKINWMTTNVIRPDGRSTATGVVLTEVYHTGGNVITAIMNESKTAGIGFNSSGTLYKIRNGLVAVVQ